MTGALTVVGLLSGTSVDAIDVAACEVRLGAVAPGRPTFHKAELGTPTRHDDGTLTLRPLGHLEYPWPDGLRERILAVLPPASTGIGEVCALDNEIGQAFAAAAVHAVDALAGGRADLVATLGQTVFHDVRDGRCHGTLQLGQPAWIAEATGLPVVSDLRSSDVAAGGHGAPLASTLDALLLAGGPQTGAAKAALNIGGIANATILAADGAVLAFDAGPGNCLLDLATARITGGALSCDRDGVLARAGTVRDDLLAALAAHPYFTLPPPKSCGRELFDATYVDGAVAAVPPVTPADLLATLTELTARTVAAALAPYRLAEVIASGGGIRNPALMAALRRELPAPSWCPSDTLGLPADAKEAYLVALLGALTWHGLPGTVTGRDGRTVTGARHTAVLGRISGAGHAGHATVTPPTRLHLLQAVPFPVMRANEAV